MNDFTGVMVIVLSICVGLEFVVRMVDVILERKRRKLITELAGRWLDHCQKSQTYRESSVIKAVVFLLVHGQLPPWASESIKKEQTWESMKK